MTLRTENSDLKTEIKNNEELAEQSTISAEKESEFENKIKDFNESGI